MSTSPAGTRAGVSEIVGVRPNTGKGISHALSLAPDPGGPCAGTREGGWQKCHAPRAWSTQYCIGHLRQHDPQRYEIERKSRGEQT